MQVWKENIIYLKKTMNRMKLRLIELHRRNLAVAFVRWREGTDRKRMVELLGVTEDLMNDNQELRNTLSRCYQEEERLQQCKFRQQSLKIERLRNLINRNALKKMLIVWAENAWFAATLEKGLWKATKTVDRRRMKNGFDRYLLKVKEIKREEYIMNKVAWFQKCREKKTCDNVFDAW
jgi:hypothetical protein